MAEIWVSGAFRTRNLFSAQDLGLVTCRGQTFLLITRMLGWINVQEKADGKNGRWQGWINGKSVGLLKHARVKKTPKTWMQETYMRRGNDFLVTVWCLVPWEPRDVLFGFPVRWIHLMSFSVCLRDFLTPRLRCHTFIIELFWWYLVTRIKGILATPPKTTPPRNKGLIAGLIKGNQWLISP